MNSSHTSSDRDRVTSAAFRHSFLPSPVSTSTERSTEASTYGQSAPTPSRKNRHRREEGRREGIVVGRKRTARAVGPFHTHEASAQPRTRGSRYQMARVQSSRRKSALPSTPCGRGGRPLSQRAVRRAGAPSARRRASGSVGGGAPQLVRGGSAEPSGRVVEGAGVENSAPKMHEVGGEARREAKHRRIERVAHGAIYGRRPVAEELAGSQSKLGLQDARAGETVAALAAHDV